MKLFSFFKKRDSRNVEVELLRAVCEQLPVKYSYITQQVKEGIIRQIVEISPNSSFRAVKHYVDILNKFDNRKIKEFQIDNIVIKDSDTGYVSNMILSIADGIIIAYALSNREGLKSSIISSLTIDLSHICEKYSGLDNPVLKKLKFTKEEMKYINPSDIYELDELINGKAIFHVFDLEDGDFIGIDINKNVYKVTHDPFGSELLSTDLLSVLKRENL